jgi:3-hydroxymyristoyl/3-hydroxydecanoyl-(acyl carrier protein) dehydratase
MSKEMKKKIMFAALLIIGFSAALSAQNTPKVDARQSTQKARIRDGVKDGELTKKEAKIVRAEQRHIKKVEKKAKSDGEITAKERAKLDRKQDRASKRIVKQKNDNQTRN